MNNTPKIFVGISVFLILAAPLQAAEIENTGTPMRKLQRGFLNIVLSPFEISNQLDKEKKNDTLPPSWVAGLGKGIAFASGRALVGVYEMVTFPLPWPDCYKPILNPEFAWDHLPPADKK